MERDAFTFIVSTLQGMKELTDYFPECLEKACEDQPVILVLDSLDQLSVDDGGRQLDWFPRNLPYNTYAVLSTLPGSQYQCLPNLRVSKLLVGDVKIWDALTNGFSAAATAMIIDLVPKRVHVIQ